MNFNQNLIKIKLIILRGKDYLGHHVTVAPVERVGQRLQVGTRLIVASLSHVRHLIGWNQHGQVFLLSSVGELGDSQLPGEVLGVVLANLFNALQKSHLTQ